MNSYHLIANYVDSNHVPLVIMDVYEGTLLNSGLESTADLTMNQTSLRAACGMAWSLRDLRGLNLIALRLSIDRSHAWYHSKQYKGLGFAPKQDSIKAAAPDPKVPAPMNARQQHFVEQCIALCQRKGIKLVFASHFARRDRRGIFHAPLANYMDSILAGTGIPYLDFTNAPGIDDKNWFADHNHLNAAGARIFTGQLVDSLEALGYWPHRPDAQDAPAAGPY